MSVLSLTPVIEGQCAQTPEETKTCFHLSSDAPEINLVNCLICKCCKFMPQLYVPASKHDVRLPLHWYAQVFSVSQLQYSLIGQCASSKSLKLDMDAYACFCVYSGSPLSFAISQGLVSNFMTYECVHQIVPSQAFCLSPVIKGRQEKSVSWYITLRTLHTLYT